MNEAVIVAGLRTAVGKAPRGALRTTRPDDMAAEVIAALLKKTPNLPPEAIDDVIIGCAMPEAESGTNVTPPGLRAASRHVVGVEHLAAQPRAAGAQEQRFQPSSVRLYSARVSPSRQKSSTRCH